MGNANWYYQFGGEVHGPMPPAELRQKVAAGEVQPDTLVRKGAEGRWVRAERVRGLLQPTDSPPAVVSGHAEEKLSTGQEFSVVCF